MAPLDGAGQGKRESRAGRWCRQSPSLGGCSRPGRVPTGCPPQARTAGSSPPHEVAPRWVPEVSPCAHRCLGRSGLRVCCWLSKLDVSEACPAGAGVRSWGCPMWVQCFAPQGAAGGFEFPPDSGLLGVGVEVDVVSQPLLSYLFPRGPSLFT